MRYPTCFCPALTPNTFLKARDARRYHYYINHFRQHHFHRRFFETIGENDFYCQFIFFEWFVLRTGSEIITSNLKNDSGSGVGENVPR